MQATVIDEQLQARTSAAAPILELEPKAAQLPVVAQQPQPSTTPSDPYRMLELAVERGMPPEVIEKFMAMAERLEQMRERDRQRKAESAYTAALAALKAEVVTVVKRKAVDYPGKSGRVSYKHAELSDVMEAVAEAAEKNGLSWNYPGLDQGEEPRKAQWITVTCRLKHIDGYSESISLGGPPDDSGGKNSIQSIHSTITYLERITLKALLGISEKGEDNDGRGAAPNGGQKAEAEATELDALRESGQAAAIEGTKPLTDWWGALNNKQRSLMNREFGALRRAAAANDKPVDHAAEARHAR